MSIELATAYVSLVPSAKGMGDNVAKELAPIEQVAEETGQRAGEKFASGFKTLSKIGAAVAGAGLVLAKEGEAATASTLRLKRAVENAGVEFDGYSKGLDKAIDREAKYGVSAEEVRAALTTLTLKLKDPNKALDQLQLITDVAAAKNISFAAATGLVTKALSGNAKVLGQFGINVKAAKDAQNDATKAANEQKTASEKLWRAQVDLNDLQATLAASTKLTASETRSLREAEDGLNAAQAGGDPNKIADAQQRLADVRARLLESTTLTVPQEIALRKAHEDVATATAALEAATTTNTAAQAQATAAVAGTDAAVSQLRTQVAGFADDQANTMTGRLQAIQTSFENVREEMGQRFGPALTVLGTAFSVGTGIAGQITTVSDLLDTKLVTSLKGAELGFNGTAAAAATTTLAFAGAVGGGVALGLELHQLIEEHFPAFNRALEAVGARVSDLNEEIRQGPGLLGKLGDAMNKLTTLNPTVGVGKFIGAKISDLFRADGGPVMAGRPYIVGERRPELFVPSTSGVILPSVGGAGQKVVGVERLYASPSQSPAEIGRIAARETAWAIKT